MRDKLYVIYVVQARYYLASMFLELRDFIRTR